MRYVLLVLSLAILSCSSHKNIITQNILTDEYLRKIAYTPEYDVQIIYTQVDTKHKKFRSYTFNVDDEKYFYPASTVKMPVAILALQKLNELCKQDTVVLQSDIMLTAAVNEKLIPAFADSTTENKKPSLERYVQKIFAVSDNDAYNRIYEFLGPDYINQTLQSKKFKHTVIRHRLSIPGLSASDNQTTNNVRFFRNNKVIYDKPQTVSTKQWIHKAKSTFKGVGYIDARDSLIHEPFDFSHKNFYALRDMETTLQRILFPEYFAPKERFDITEDDYTFLKKCMSDLPHTYTFYANKPDEYPDSYVKFLMFGASKESIPDDIKIYNKVGNAYGYLIDCAFIENKSKNVGFFLTAVIHVNKNKIYNDGKYEYDETGFPFMARLGQKFYEYELNRGHK